MDLYLTRFAYMPDMVLGILMAGPIKLATIEEPWVANPKGPGGLPHSVSHMGSCVPDGDYQLYPHNTVAHPDVWALVNTDLGVYRDVPPAGQDWGRGACLIHTGNTTRDTEGCIIVGLRHVSSVPQQNGTIDMVVQSKEALAQLHTVVPRDTINRLIIRAYTGTSLPLPGATA